MRINIFNDWPDWTKKGRSKCWSDFNFIRVQYERNRNRPAHEITVMLLGIGVNIEL